MKIKIDVTLELTDEGVRAWMLEYGVDRPEVREDIRSYVRNQVQECTGGQVAEWKVEGPR